MTGSAPRPPSGRIALIGLGFAGLAVAVVGLLLGFSRRLLNRDKRVAAARIVDPSDSTTTDPSGAVRSVQGADLYLDAAELDRIWSPMHLERLARTYWRFLTRATLGLVRIHYTERERFVVLAFAALKLLTFQAPEYEMDADRGIVRWRIERGLLVAGRGRGGNGYLQIDVHRCAADNRVQPGQARLHVEVEVANFYPAIASGIGRWAYNETQSRVHVIITHGFLRSLARLDLAESRVGRFAQVHEVPDPPAVGVRSPTPEQQVQTARGAA